MERMPVTVVTDVDAVWSLRQEVMWSVLPAFCPSPSPSPTLSPSSPLSLCSLSLSPMIGRAPSLQLGRTAEHPTTVPSSRQPARPPFNFC